MFDQSGELRTLESQSEGKSEIQEYVRHNNRFPDKVEIFRARYDEFIRYSDKSFQYFISQLEERNLLDETVIIFSSDHGEIFKHNSLLHGSTLYEPETNIPLIIKEPGGTEGQLIQDVVSQKDIPATILDLAGIPLPQWMEGRSLLPFMRGDNLPSRPVFSMNLEKNYLPPSPISKGVIAVWEGDYKLIYYLDKDKSLLFNLKEDPDEMNNLFDKEPEVGKRLLGLIKESLKKANERIISLE
jgi:arylsulfatase A-like enzyme